MLLYILAYFTLALSAVIPSTSSSTFHLTEQEKEYLKNDPKVTHKITFTISQGKSPAKKLGKLTLALFGETVPITVDNFYQLSAMTRGYGYQDCEFHRIINDFMIQGGNYDGQGGKSIYGGSFNDENFDLKHDKLGRLSMANAGQNTNGGQFFILDTEKTPHLDGKHVVFGQLIDGFDTLDKISSTDVVDSRPVEQIYISEIDTAAFDYNAQEAEEKAEQLKPEDPIAVEDAKVDAEEIRLSAIYPFFLVLLLVGALGVAYKKMRKRLITDIRSNHF